MFTENNLIFNEYGSMYILIANLSVTTVTRTQVSLTCELEKNQIPIFLLKNMSERFFCRIKKHQRNKMV